MRWDRLMQNAELMVFVGAGVLILLAYVVSRFLGGS